VSVIAAIASRDVMKLLRDPGRLVGSLIFPVVILGLLGGSLQANLGRTVGFNYIGFTFTGVLGMTMFQSTAQGIASLLEDRQNDFAQEMFVSPISRYSIVLGKIVGETGVALVQGLPLVALAMLLRVPLTPAEIALLVPAAIAGCLLGGAFGLVAMAAINSQQSANQLFNFLLLPQFFLAGVFNPIKILPWYLDLASRISPMRYVVDLSRDVAFAGRPEYSKVVLLGPIENLIIMGAMFGVFMAVGTALFVRRETNR
jgi:ABC-2 type transport system permease protein